MAVLRARGSAIEVRPFRQGAGGRNEGGGRRSPSGCSEPARRGTTFVRLLHRPAIPTHTDPQMTAGGYRRRSRSHVRWRTRITKEIGQDRRWGEEGGQGGAVGVGARSAHGPSGPGSIPIRAPWLAISSCRGRGSPPRSRRSPRERAARAGLPGARTSGRVHPGPLSVAEAAPDDPERPRHGREHRRGARSLVRATFRQRSALRLGRRLARRGRQREYHQLTDTPDTLDYGFLQGSAKRVTEALLRPTR